MELHEKKQQIYHNTFTTPYGEQVLEDLEKQVRRASVDLKDVNPYNAVYRVAQEDLLFYIKKWIQGTKE